MYIFGFKEKHTNLSVPPIESHLIVPSNYVAVGDNVTVTCTVDRVKPPLTNIYLEYDGIIIQGNSSSFMEKETATPEVYMQSQIFVLSATQETQSPNLLWYWTSTKLYPIYT